ncbi:PDDEXK family nuclease [Roseivivax sediminis]|uniref:TnsA endonuclease N terminal n=1 Tax=Roseivivax sediminis TaxID=936889 RepID=A0A1I2EIP3_9RHOB|nr:hypothetical protein [Roseivivax sediminis]SFE92619.1 hypothetical protein SAMN04515678_12412 [Roseivivax sediminis]
MTDDMIIEHDEWPYSPKRLPRQAKIQIPGGHGVLPARAVRNTLSVSSSTQKTVVMSRTEANDYRPEVGYCDSAAEAAVAHEVLVSPNTYDVEFQPFTLPITLEGKDREHTMDLRVTLRNGERRAIFVRNRRSLMKARTQAEIDAIRRALGPEHRDRFMVVDADDFSRARRENLSRMYDLVFRPDKAADELVEEAAYGLGTLWLLRDLVAVLDLQPARVWQSAMRLIARGRLLADLDAVFCHYSRVWLPQ